MCACRPNDTGQVTIHASAVLIGSRAALIRGPAGSGKSRLAFDLIEAAANGSLPFCRLVADDRTEAEARGGRLILRPAAALAGLIEVRGLGIRRLAYEPLAVAGLVVDLGAADADRLPAPEAATALVEGVKLPRLAVAAGLPALPMVLGYLKMARAGD
jgi:HPr kinase/phosphorylase